MNDPLQPIAIGTALARLDGHAKVTGTAPYAFEYPVSEPLYLHPVQAAIARGRVTAIDTASARALDGTVAVITHENAPRLASDKNRELWILQSDEIHFRGQFIAAVIAETAEIARHAASLIQVEYAPQPHDVALRADRDDLYAPDKVAGFPARRSLGDVDTALKSAPVTIDHSYTTPPEYNNPMEPHTTTAIWADGMFTLYDSTQGVHDVRATLAPVFGLDPAQIRVIAAYVGGGFGSKGLPHAHNVLVGLAAQLAGGRPVRFALTRQQMFSLAGYRTPTIQRLRLGAGRDGRLAAIAHEVVEQTARIKEFGEQTAICSRVMYAAPNRRTAHRLAALDLPANSWMRAPGETPGMFAAEVAMDELAVACELDPIELRVRNEPAAHPESGRPWSGRNLLGCLREGSHRFGWQPRDPAPGVRRQGGWLVGTGVAASSYPHFEMPGSVAAIHYGADRRYTVRIGAVDIGTGTRTALTQIAADALGCPLDAVRLEIGDTDLPMATVEGGSTGINCWGSAIVAAARVFRDRHGSAPEAGASAEASSPEDSDAKKFAVHSFGAQFAEVHVHADTGEVRVPRMLGVFSVGRIINPRTARSQFIGGMTMGLSMALHEEGIIDPRFGHVVNHDFAGYHIATHADINDIEAIWLDESDPHANPMGARGIGEIGIVGTAAAIVNAVYHATGVRVRNLPVTPDKLIHA
ncbi:MAG TPA: xanthine dehydrogenase family protein molybdopterin-binding subunit [Burkholderiales bacterium]|jgi:xanthine dehydrogenase YagR molybdenum-binding subunit|nr:xanthine dehydrogenase family protein molybdopterin-binding subunit [Burkholderiales bacterium]